MKRSASVSSVRSNGDDDDELRAPIDVNELVDELGTLLAYKPPSPCNDERDWIDTDDGVPFVEWYDANAARVVCGMTTARSHEKPPSEPVSHAMSAHIDALVAAMPKHTSYGTTYAEYVALDALVASAWLDTDGGGGGERQATCQSSSLVDELVLASPVRRAAFLEHVSALLLAQSSLAWALGWYARFSWSMLAEHVHTRVGAMRLDAVLAFAYALLLERPSRLLTPDNFELLVCREIMAALTTTSYWGAVYVLVASRDNALEYEHASSAFIRMLRACAASRQAVRLTYSVRRQSIDVALEAPGVASNIKCALDGDDGDDGDDDNDDDDKQHVKVFDCVLRAPCKRRRRRTLTCSLLLPADA